MNTVHRAIRFRLVLNIDGSSLSAEPYGQNATLWLRSSKSLTAFADALDRVWEEFVDRPLTQDAVRQAAVMLCAELHNRSPDSTFEVQAYRRVRVATVYEDVLDVL
jgi:hypothetical protein